MKLFKSQNCFLIPAVLLALGQPVAAQTDENKYASCMDMAEKAPDRGINMALVWQNAGGGVPARHCEAVGLFYAGEYGEAAARLETIVDDMRTGRNMPITDGKRIVATAPMLADMYSQAANAWLMADEIVRAETAIDTALSLVSGTSGPGLGYKVLRARIAARDGDYGLAFEELTAVSRADPGRMDILLLLASAARQSYRLEDAETALDRYIEVYASDPAAYLEQGNLFDQQGKWAEARAAWIKVLNLVTDGVDADAARANLERTSVKRRDD